MNEPEFFEIEESIVEDIFNKSGITKSYKIEHITSFIFEDDHTLVSCFELNGKDFEIAIYSNNSFEINSENEKSNINEIPSKLIELFIEYRKTFIHHEKK